MTARAQRSNLIWCYGKLSDGFAILADDLELVRFLGLIEDEDDSRYGA
jgi:hypothetical protein